jgi:hypothetical protein
MIAEMICARCGEQIADRECVVCFDGSKTVCLFHAACWRAHAKDAEKARG